LKERPAVLRCYVKVTGTAMDALKAAVGEGNVVAPGGFITEILGERW